MNHLEVKTDKLPLVSAVLLGLILVPLGLGSLATGILRGFRIMPVLIGAAVLLLFGVVIWLVRRGHAKSVKYFSDEGLTRNDGRSFLWTDLNRVVNQWTISSTGNRKVLWRTEIQFSGGESAWLLPTKISNLAEVSNFVNKLPCEHTEVRV